MREIKFYFNDISIISINETFIFASIFNLKTLNKSRECLLVFGLENHVTQIKQFAMIFDFIAILQENNNTHVILINQKILYEKLCIFKDNLYKPNKIQLNAFIDLIGPVRKFAFPNKFKEYSEEFGITINLDDSNELIVSKEFTITKNVEFTKELGKDFLIRLCNNMSYINKIGINIRHISCAELNNTNISYSIGEVQKIIKEIEIDKSMQLHEISKKDDDLYTALVGLNQSLTSITAKQSLISLWSTIETLFSGKSKSLFTSNEQKKIIKFIDENINNDKSKIIKKQLPNLKNKTRNDLIVDNILNLNSNLNRESVDNTIKKASRLRAKCSHKSSSQVDKKELNISNKKLKEFIELYIKSKKMNIDI